MRTISKLVILALFALSMTSCGSDEGNPTITASVTGTQASYSPEETVSFSIAATDDTGVTSIAITNTDLGINQLVEEFGGANSGVDVTVNFDLTLASNTADGDYKIKFEATDLDGNTEDTEVEITVAE